MARAGAVAAVAVLCSPKAGTGALSQKDVLEGDANAADGNQFDLHDLLTDCKISIICHSVVVG